MAPPITRRVISGFPLRRAVLGILLNADGPVTVTEIVDALHAAGVTTNPRLVKAPCGIVANLLDHQESRGRVIRTDRASYLLDPTGWSRSTRWRYANWRRLERRDRDQVG